MIISCKVIEDILPIYYDGVCSLESASLVEEHLKECPQCKQNLADLHCKIEIPQEPVDDLKPLKGIQKKWKRCKRNYIRRGICITLAVLLLLASILTGIWYFSYARYYYQMTEPMEHTSKEDKFYTSSDYTTERNGYRFEVWLPVVLSNSGFVRVMDENGLVLFLYPEAGGNYSFWLYITDENNQSYSVYLKSDMTPDFENHQLPVRTETQKEQITQLLLEQQSDVISIMNAVQALWGIDLLKYAP